MACARPLLAIWVALVGSVALAGEEARKPEAPPRTRVVWLQPLATGFYGAYLDDHGLLIPLGVTWPLNADLDLVTEVSVGTGLPSACGPSALDVWGSVGAATRGSRGPLNGGFVHTKLLVRHSSGSGERCDASGGGLAVESEVSAGIDFGLQQTLGPLYVALVLGFHVGHCWNCPMRSLYSFGPLGQDPPRGDSVKIGLNANFLRVGWAF